MMRSIKKIIKILIKFHMFVAIKNLSVSKELFFGRVPQKKLMHAMAAPAQQVLAKNMPVPLNMGIT